MGQEPTPAAEPEGQEPEGKEGQEPTPTEPESKESKTFDEDYVKALRKEAAQARTKLHEAEERLRELTDRDKSESERATERAAELERRAGEAEAKLLRLEVATDKKLDAKLVKFLTGTTREELEEQADELVAYAAEQQAQAARSATPRGFDGGARQTPEKKGSPEEEHQKLLLNVLGRAPR